MIAASRRQSLSKNRFCQTRADLICGDLAGPCVTTANTAINVRPPPAAAQKKPCGQTAPWCRKPAVRANDYCSGLPGGAINLADTVLAAELLNPPAGIDDFLLAGIERMTCRAHFDEEVLTKGGASREFVAAATGNLDIVVGGMNLGFHLGRPEVLQCAKGA